MDRLHAMETFVRVVETGSFSAAARSLGIGQPAVSKAVAGLEAWLGTRLLARSTRRLSPTEAGHAYYEHARRALAEAEEAEVAARGLGSGLAGRLRVCAPVTFARLHVAPRLGAFLDAHPRLRLELVMDDRTIDLLEENIDVALRLGAQADFALTARRLASCPRYVVASPDYLARHGTPRHPGELASHAAVLHTRQSGDTAWRFRRGDVDVPEEVAVEVPGRVAFTAAEGVWEGLLAGLGIAIASHWMVAPELAAGTLVALLPGWNLPDMELWAVFPAGRLPTAKARAFVGWLDGVLDRDGGR